MNFSEMGNFIRVIEVPDFKAPRGACEVWVGLILPSFPYVGVYARCRQWEITKDKRLTRTSHNFAVPYEEAINVLERENLQVARWWESKGSSLVDNFFVFDQSEVEIITALQPWYSIPYRAGDEEENAYR